MPDEINIRETLKIILLLSTFCFITVPNIFSSNSSPRKVSFGIDGHYRENRTWEENDRQLSASGEYEVKWEIDLGGKEQILESDFLTAGLERSIKDYINNKMACDGHPQGASFYGIKIEDEPVTKVGISKKSGRGKCKANATRCKRKIKETISDAGKQSGIVLNARSSKKDLCASVENATIFDVLKDTLLKASSFNYDVDVDVINDLSGILDLKYQVQFLPSRGNGLDEIANFDLEPQEPRALGPTNCDPATCGPQKSAMRAVFDHFKIPLDGDKHECLYQGINCNNADLVTHIWITNSDLESNTLPPELHQMTELTGLFLGGNNLRGTLPTWLGDIKKLEMLWLEDNNFTGEIPPQLGNLRKLKELNLHDNKLSGSIPSKLGNLQSLQFLNLGNNNLNGKIPFNIVNQEKNETDLGCESFVNPFDRIVRKWLPKMNEVEFDPLVNLKTLALHGNRLSGMIPSAYSKLTSLVDLSLGSNLLSGSIPSDIKDLIRLKVFDVHNNSLTGAVPDELFELSDLEILNVHNNSLSNTIPTEVGKLRHLKELIFDDNLLSGPLPSEVGQLLRLEYLTFSGNKMGGELPSELGNLVSLRNLDLRDYSSTIPGGNKKSPSVIPSELGLLTNWKFVVFQNNGFEGTLPHEFGNLASATTMWLKNEKLSGGIPPELGQLNNLSSLSLGGNKLDGPIPSTIAFLPELSTFDIENNGITGEIPMEMGDAPKLKYMGLGNLMITGQVPTTLGKISTLEFLFMENNTLVGAIPSQIGELKSLKALNMRDNTLSGEIPTDLAGLSEIHNLFLGDNALNGTIPSEFGTLHKLLNIAIDKNALTGGIPSHFGKISGLKNMDLRGNRLGGNIPSEFGDLSVVEELAFGSNSLTGNIPSHMGKLKTLVTLGVEENELSGSIPSEIGLIERLVSLNLGKNLFTGSLPNELANLQELNALILSGNDLTGYQYFVCRLEVFSSGNDPDVDCSDFCGTVDEQCSGADIRDAQCSAVGCNGDGIPSCTSKCRLDYSSCTAGAGQQSIQIELITDNKGYESRWEIKNLDSEIVWQSEHSYRSRDTITEFRCMEKGCHRFELFDSGGDGVCCGEKNPEDLGSYSLWDDEVQITSTNPEFGSSIIHDLGVCPPDPRRPSASPSAKPTGLSSLVPTMIPSQHPSIHPSNSPSISPSEHPSIKPSYLSSVVPTVSLVPTQFPSMKPSSSPSSLPSISLQPTLYPTSMPTSSPSALPTVSFIPTAKFNKLWAPDGATGHEFGFDVAISNSVIAVSAPKAGNGKVYLFHPITWAYTSTLEATDGSGSDQFGSSIATQGDVIVVGAVLGNKAYIMSITSSFATVPVTAGLSDDQFGKSVAFDDDTTVIGAPNNDENGVESGAAYIYSAAGTFVRKIMLPTFGANANFGASVDVRGTKVAIGAPSIGTKGAVYLYDLSGTYLGVKIEDVSGVSGDSFGSAVAILDNIVVAGAPFHDTGGSNAGAAYFSTADGTVVTKILAFDAQFDSYFGGGKVAISSEKIIIGAMKDGASDAGAVYVYSNAGTFIEKKVAFDAGAGSEFGTSVAISGEVYIVGAPFDDDLGAGSGSAYVYHP